MRGHVARATAAARRWINLGLDLCRGGDRRHAAGARVAAVRHRLRWRARRALRGGGRRSVVIALTEHFGDIVAAEPITRFVRREHPDAHVSWVVRGPYRELIDTNPNVDATVVVGCLGEWCHLARSGAFGDARVLDLHVHGRDCPKCHQAVQQTPGRRDIDVTNYYRHGNLLEIFCRSAGLPVLSDGPHVYIPDSARSAVDALRLPSRFAAIHCTSNQDVRDWDAGKWPRLVGLLGSAGVPVVEVGTRAVVAAPGANHYRDLCGSLSLLETAEVIRRAGVFIGVDSGPAHLANAVGTYGVILLGHYRSYKWYMPYSGRYADGSNAHVIHADAPASAIPVEQVFTIVEERLRPAAAPDPAAAPA